MTTQHTPTPWNWHGPYMTGAYKVSAMDAEDRLALRLYIEPSSNAESDAKFIVRACNAHDELVAALSTMLGSAEIDCLDDKSNVWRSAMIDARAVLAKIALAKVSK